MDCKLTSFDMALHEVKPLTNEEDKKDCVSILVEDSLPALLDFGVQKKCFTQFEANIFSAFIPKFYSYDEPTYWEEDIDMRDRLEEAMGIDEETFKKYSY